MQSLPLINERLLRLLVGFLDLFFRSLASSSSSSSSSSSNSKNSSHSNSNSNKANAKSESKQNPGSTFNYAPTLRAFANAIMRTDNCSCYSAPPSPPSTSPSTSPSPSTSTSTLTSMSTIVPGSAVSTLVASATSTFATVTGSPAVASVAAIGAMNRAVASKLLFCLLRHRNYLWRVRSCCVL
jgi:cytoskeletal protein RodZ